MEVKLVHGNGNHACFDCFGCSREALGDEASVRGFLDEMPGVMGMRKLSEPLVIRHEHEKKQESGITGFVIIAESHISIHTYPEKGHAFIDIFSCKEFDTGKAEGMIRGRFSPERIERNDSMRGTYRIGADGRLEEVAGITGSEGIASLVKDMKRIGFQATNLGRAADVIKEMRENGAKIFLSFTSNMVSSGLREMFAHMAKHKMIDVIITTVGSIEEDLMKTHKPFLVGSFEADDTQLHKRGINRIGNIFVPNDRYEWLEGRLMPFFSDMYKRQKERGKPMSPRSLIHELGKTVDDDKSILHWASKNDIPIFCPAITDGAMGLHLHFFKQENEGFALDATGDMKELADIVLNAEKTGGIILGGGVPKHHTIGVNILRDGLDYAVYVSTATEGDGSLSGARVKEAVSWGKISETAKHVYVEGDATIVFPLLFHSMKV